VLFGTHPAVVSTTPTLLADASWEDLATYHGTNRWRIEFLTPVSVRANQTDQPWPEPYTILNNLERKWQRWGPIPHKGFEEAVTKRLSVVWADLKTQISELPPHRTTAVTGCVEWLAPYRSDDAQVVERLLRFAEYAGFGGRTEHGLGTVRVSGGIDPSHPRRSKKPEG
jgi:CRISPR-associated endoribonuclease Cas6